MKIIFGADYKAMPYRDDLVRILRELGEVTDVVQLDPALSDYVEVSQRASQNVVSNNAYGVLICGTGIGVCVVANKYSGIYAARCVSEQDAIDSKTINNANMLCLSAATPVATNERIVRAFFQTKFPGDEKRTRRLEKIAAMEKSHFKKACL